MLGLGVKVHDNAIMIWCTDCMEPWFIPIENMQGAQGIRETIKYQDWFMAHMLRRHNLFFVHAN